MRRFAIAKQNQIIALVPLSLEISSAKKVIPLNKEPMSISK
jgi:hypothetical protein